MRVVVPFHIARPHEVHHHATGLPDGPRLVLEADIGHHDDLPAMVEPNLLHPEVLAEHLTVRLGAVALQELANAELTDYLGLTLRDGVGWRRPAVYDLHVNVRIGLPVLQVADA